MKKFLSTALALTMLLLTACGNNAGNSADSTDPNASTTSNASIYEDLSGFKNSDVLVTIDGNEVPASVYLYWSLSLASNMEYQVQMYNTYYGMYGDMLNADGTLKWDAEFREGVTAEEYVRDYIEETIIRLAAVENMAKEYGIALTEADQAEIVEYKQSIADGYKEQLQSEGKDVEGKSAEEIIDMYLAYLGIDRSTFDRLTASPYLFSGLSDAITTEGSPLYLSNEDYDAYGFYADHILLATMDTETYTEYEPAVAAEQLALAENILAQLRESSDPIALFAQLADEYSEDPGRATNPTGYIFTSGQMVAEFEATTAELKPGEISDIVKSNYGYHIILRRDLSEGLAAYPEQKAALVELYLDELVTAKMDAAEVVYADGLSSFSFVDFYNAYNNRLRQEAMSDSILNSDNNDTTSQNASSSTSK